MSAMVRTRCVPHFDLKRCKACGLCVSVCPAEVLELIGPAPALTSDACTGCGSCELVCPDFAILMVEERPEPDVVPCPEEPETET